jgi:threonine dehydrogenase-like Zn-dependent dehydrogenase
MDFAFDAAGAQDGIDAGLASLRPRGVFLNVAGWEKSPTIDMNLVLIREITITGKYRFLRCTRPPVNSINVIFFFAKATVCYNGIHPEMLTAVASGRIQGISDVITKKISLENLVQEGLLSLLHEKDTQGKSRSVRLSLRLTIVSSQSPCSPLRLTYLENVGLRVKNCIYGS